MGWSHRVDTDFPLTKVDPQGTQVQLIFSDFLIVNGEIAGRERQNETAYSAHTGDGLKKMIFTSFQNKIIP